MSEQELKQQAPGKRPPEAKVAQSAPGPGPFDDEHPPPIDFDTWAALAARLLGRDVDERLEILAERRLDPPLWEQCETYWALCLAREIIAGRLGRADDYAGRCASELATRRRSAASVGVEPGVDETVWMLTPSKAPALPFAAAPGPSAPGPIVRPDDKQLDLAGETQTIGDPAPDGAPLPFVPTLSLEQYAALCAELASRPADCSAVASAYGISSPQQLQALHLGWLRRFDREPALRHGFAELERKHRESLCAGQRGRRS